jgi:predicted Zn-dependent protease
MNRVLGVLALGLVVALAAAPAAAALIGERQEIALGRQAASELERTYGLVIDPARQERVTAIGMRLARSSDRPHLPWTFRILNVRDTNALSLPGGFVYVTRGMLGFVRSDDELAFVLAHEVAHVNQRHHVQLLERNFLLSIVAQLLFGRDATAEAVANFVRFLLSRGFTREFEFEADRVGVLLVHRTGFRADAALQFLERLRRAEGRDPSQFEVLFRTHPALGDRILRVRDQLRSMGYPVSRAP